MVKQLPRIFNQSEGFALNPRLMGTGRSPRYTNSQAVINKETLSIRLGEIGLHCAPIEPRSNSMQRIKANGITENTPSTRQHNNKWGETDLAQISQPQQRQT